VTIRNVVVIGDVMLDVIVKPDAPIAATSDTPSRVRLSRGGAAANMAEVLARAGHHVTYVGACGDDLAAQHFEDTLNDVGIDVALERVVEATGVVVALVDQAGQRAMMTDRGANSALGISHVLQQLAQPTIFTSRATPCWTHERLTSGEGLSPGRSRWVALPQSTSAPWRR